MPDLPTGTLTHLFTDLEGSTVLWQDHPEAMRVAAARHDSLLREAIHGCGGVVVKTTGDGFHAVFAVAADALRAALQAQQAVRREAWEEIPPLRFRMGLHTAAAELRDGDYYGAGVNRAARLMAAGHGGQILLSGATQELVRDQLPVEVTLRDLGEHHLRDLARPERVYQLLHPDLPETFPPLRSPGAPPNNLPRQLTSFIGREKELADVKRLLSATRLLTLVGTGGCGKTRLALHAAEELLPEYPDGVWLAELAPLADLAGVPQAVAAALGVREKAGQPLTQTLAEYLKPKSLFLLLDNAEHLLATCAHLVETLLRACPSLRLLVTSRENLNVAGETTYRVPSLSLPDPNHLPGGEGISHSDAVRLFLDRAAAASPAFAMTSVNTPAVAQVCLRLDGIPLALELAAARVKALPVEGIAKRLDDRFRLLTGGSRTALPRQQTLQAAIGWSYDLLSESERALLRRLSVFAGGWSLEAAECVGEGEPVEAGEVLDLLARLVDKSLVDFSGPEAGSAGEARYRLLETVRQYARDRLLETGEADSARTRHRDYFLRLAEETEPMLRGPEQNEWLARLETDHDNLRAALEWCRSREGDAEAGLRLAEALYRFWNIHDHLTEGREWLESTLARTEDRKDSVTRGKALNWLAVLAWRQGESDDMLRPWLEESLAILRKVGDRAACAETLNTLADLLLRQGEDADARALYEEAVALNREAGSVGNNVWPLRGLATVADRAGDADAARAFLELSIAAGEESGDKMGLAQALNTMGIYLRRGDEADSARAYLERSLVLCRELGDKTGVADSLNRLAELAFDQGDMALARMLVEESRTVAREMEDRSSLAYTLVRLATAALAQGDLPTHREALEELRSMVSEAGFPHAHRDSLMPVLSALTGHYLLDQGDAAGARVHYEKALALRRASADGISIGWSLLEVGHAAWCEQDWDAVRACISETVELFRESGYQIGLNVSLESLAAAAAGQGRMEAAARLLGACRDLELRIIPWWRRPHDRIVDALREVRESDSYARAREEGLAMGVDQAIACELSEGAR